MPGQFTDFICQIVNSLRRGSRCPKSIAHSQTLIKQAIMANGNNTAVTEFILLGLTGDLNLQVIFFLVFLVVYSVTLLGNLVIIILIRTNSQLQTPMYFFLSHLSFSDMCFSSSVTPKMLVNFLAEKTISYPACVIQFWLAATCGFSECFLLAVMAYDRYAAICSPLIYTLIISEKVCASLVAASYIVSLMNSLLCTYGVFRLFFCGPNQINHFYCDTPPLLKLSCSDTHLAKIFQSSSAGITVIITCGTIITSYIYILISILRMPTKGGRRKAFSTCASHLLAVTLFYGTVTFIYVMPSSDNSMDLNKMVSVFYMVMIPMLNPMIYCLRNKDVMEALKRTVLIKGVS
ncbi:olfactory receptor 502-like [Tachyglossus aculeatus]|uniref:olfactory receptor 502-like n=1 Tax=Tachyglossus aculeatus TaxID=9261 RepID=UPI0018F30F2E|nr:olfactory receptor 502-like [Tachyglossus aculeatus]